MARRKSTRGNRKFVAIPFTRSVTLGSLAADTIVTGVLLNGLAEDLLVHSIKYEAQHRGNTAGEGPLSFGVAHGDYTVAEIEECLDSNLADPDNKIAVEQANRLVRRMGNLPVINADDVAFNGGSRKTKLNWVIGSGNDLNLWGYNQSGATLASGGIITIQGTVFGTWLR